MSGDENNRKRRPIGKLPRQQDQGDLSVAELEIQSPGAFPPTSTYRSTEDAEWHTVKPAGKRRFPKGLGPTIATVRRDLTAIFLPWISMK
jgi:hypothetical protein